MVSKASEDFPEPDRPVTTIRRSRGRSRLMFLRLWVRAPRMRMRSSAIEWVRGMGEWVGDRPAYRAPWMGAIHRISNGGGPHKKGPGEPGPLQSPGVLDQRRAVYSTVIGSEHSVVEPALQTW